jgi:hypothetical protein
MRYLLCVAILSILFYGCGMEKKPEKQVKEHTAEEAVPENLGDPNAPSEIRALRGAKEVKQRIEGQRKEDSKVLEESDH